MIGLFIPSPTLFSAFLALGGVFRNLWYFTGQIVDEGSHRGQHPFAAHEHCMENEFPAAPAWQDMQEFA
jgi:hypothetical protein